MVAGLVSCRRRLGYDRPDSAVPQDAFRTARMPSSIAANSTTSRGQTAESASMAAVARRWARTAAAAPASRSGSTAAPGIEQIDAGGPLQIAAAMKGQREAEVVELKKSPA